MSIIKFARFIFKKFPNNKNAAHKCAEQAKHNSITERQENIAR